MSRAEEVLPRRTRAQRVNRACLTDGVPAGISASAVYHYLLQVRDEGQFNMAGCHHLLMSRFDLTMEQSMNIRDHLVTHFRTIQRRYGPSGLPSTPSGSSSGRSRSRARRSGGLPVRPGSTGSQRGPGGDRQDQTQVAGAERRILALTGGYFIGIGEDRTVSGIRSTYSPSEGSESRGRTSSDSDA
jgi:hypothetical protein